MKLASGGRRVTGGGGRRATGWAPGNGRGRGNGRGPTASIRPGMRTVQAGSGGACAAATLSVYWF